MGFGDGLNVREWAVARKVTSGAQKRYSTEAYNCTVRERTYSVGHQINGLFVNGVCVCVCACMCVCVLADVTGAGLQ